MSLLLTMKDNFSTKSAEYAKFRPSYPDELFSHILTLVQNKVNAWDCGTGNGQVAEKLASSFESIYATDISQRQLENATKRPNISYSVMPAEKTIFPDDHFDLITVAQAIHWFDFRKFYDEVRRTARNDAIIAIIGYALIKLDPAVDHVIFKLYQDVLGNFWDKERRYIDESYRTIPFPFTELEVPEFHYTCLWDFQRLIGYLNTWSAVQHYVKSEGKNPIDIFEPDLEAAWGRDKEKQVTFPILLRVGRIIKH